MEPAWDLVVVGAGPAGASAALSALRTRPDARVLLLDRSDFPRDKACGDGIAPQVLDVLAWLGVADPESGYAGVDRLEIGFASGPATDGVMARPAFVIPREVFDARLVRAAVQRGAEFRPHRVRTVAAGQDGTQIVDGTMRARVVIAADGASSVIRRQVAHRGVRATYLPADPLGLWRSSARQAGSRGTHHLAVAIRGYAPLSASRRGRQVIAFAEPDPADGAPPARGATWPAYAWSFPIGDGRANVGYGELLRADQPLTRRHLLDRLEELLPGAGEAGESWRAHLLPLSTGRPRQPDGGILFTGDAMNLINPVTGEGIFYAVASGALAGRAAVRTAGPDGDPGREYRAALRRALGWHLRHTDAAAMLARSPVVVAAALRAASRRPRTFDDLVELGLGAGKLTPASLGGIAAALLGR